MIEPTLFPTAPRFDGPCYDPAFDQGPLPKQLGRIFTLMRDGGRRTLDEIATSTGDPAARISAQLRHLRKPRFGGYTVQKRRRGLPDHGPYEYRLVADVRVDPEESR